MSGTGRPVDTALAAELETLERAQVLIESDQYAVWLLAEGLAQVRYRSRHHLDGHAQRWVLRSSLWRRHRDGWRMVFHQGHAGSAVAWGHVRRERHKGQSPLPGKGL